MLAQCLPHPELSDPELSRNFQSLFDCGDGVPDENVHLAMLLADSSGQHGNLDQVSESPDGLGVDHEESSGKAVETSYQSDRPHENDDSIFDKLASFRSVAS